MCDSFADIRYKRTVVVLFVLRTPVNKLDPGVTFKQLERTSTEDMDQDKVD